jgi:hypothetical protein
MKHILMCLWLILSITICDASGKECPTCDDSYYGGVEGKDYVICGDDYVACKEPIGPRREYGEDASAQQILGDFLILRPLMVCVSAIGLAGYVLSWPFTIVGGNEAQARKVLVSEPFAMTFTYPLGAYRVRREGTQYSEQQLSDISTSDIVAIP